jgi:cyclopropane fatty-acyl-phospholipid synthase-like methyltransferase
MYSRLLSLKNKFLDYFKFDEKRELRSQLLKINSKINTNFFDYGVGYFYQSSNVLNINGLRNSKFRKEKINIADLTYGKKLLDIGTNSGFLLLELKNNFSYALGIDYNPKLIEIANAAKNYLNISNIDFRSENFETQIINEKFDIILSLANHHTFDKGITSTENYFKKIIQILNSNGILIFESHHPQIESEKEFLKFIDFLSSDFEILRKDKYQTKNFFDNGRSFAILKKKS